VVNRGSVTATGVVLDASADRRLVLQSTALDCTGGLPCDLGDVPAGAVKTVIARYALTGGAPSQLSVQFRISGGTPAPALRDATTNVVASRAASCSSTGSGPGGALGLLVVCAWLVRRRSTA